VGSILDEVIGPDVVRVLRPQCLFLGILQSSIRLKAILQGGPLSRGQTRHV
jgi:hypothetical protein